MAEKELNPQKSSFNRRFVIPAGTSLGIWLVLNFLSTNLGWIQNAEQYRLAMNTVHALLFIVISFSSIAVYSQMFFRGASLAERVIGSYITPGAFIIKEIIRVSEFFSFMEAIYYGMSPYPFLCLITGQVGLMAVCEMVCRYLYRRKSAAGIRVVTAVPVLMAIISFACIYFMSLWHWGEDAYWIQLAIYKLIFK
jgi:hypothetical protein